MRIVSPTADIEIAAGYHVIAIRMHRDRLAKLSAGNPLVATGPLATV